MDPSNVSEKSRLVTLVLGIFTGFVGGHRFYVGKVGTGILQLCTLGGLGLWWLADVVIIGAGEFKDIHGKRVMRWMTDDEALLGAPSHPDPRLLEAMEQMQSDVYELQERVDFLERTLTQRREPPGLSAPGRP